jgi:hypothetical protein
MNEKLYLEALEIKALYRTGEIDFNETKSKLKNYEKFFNEKSIELAKKHGVKPKKFNVKSFLSF